MLLCGLASSFSPFSHTGAVQHAEGHTPAGRSLRDFSRVEVDDGVDKRVAHEDGADGAPVVRGLPEQEADGFQRSLNRQRRICHAPHFHEVVTLNALHRYTWRTTRRAPHDETFHTLLHTHAELKLIARDSLVYRIFRPISRPAVQVPSASRMAIPTQKCATQETPLYKMHLFPPILQHIAETNPVINSEDIRYGRVLRLLEDSTFVFVPPACLLLPLSFTCYTWQWLITWLGGASGALVQLK